MIGSLSPDDARAAIAIPANDRGIEFTEEALEVILAESHGYPYFLQEWGYHVWNSAPRSQVVADDVRATRPIVLDQLDRNFFLVRADRLTPRERDYLRAMAELGPGPHRSGDVSAMLGVKVESVAPRRSQLIAKGMIFSPAHGDTAFTVPLFDDYLRRTMPKWRPPGRRALEP
jgi:Mn-dependent transcriptional regulator